MSSPPDSYLTGALAALRATGTHPRHALVLLAYAAANIIELVPVTPGGLGLVEASLGGLLVLAGVHGGDALLATLAYRLASYWLPLCAGLPGLPPVPTPLRPLGTPVPALTMRHNGERLGEAVRAMGISGRPSAGQRDLVRH